MEVIMILLGLVAVWWIPFVIHVLRNGVSKVRNVWSILILVVGVAAEIFFITSPLEERLGFGSWEAAIICFYATLVLLLVYYIQWIRKTQKKGLVWIVSLFFMMIGGAIHYNEIMICGIMMAAIKLCEIVVPKMVIFYKRV